jgi:hypothetical protein
MSWIRGRQAWRITKFTVMPPTWSHYFLLSQSLLHMHSLDSPDMQPLYKLASRTGPMNSSRLATWPPPRTLSKMCSAMRRRTVEKANLLVSKAMEKLLVLRTQQLDLSGRGNLT